MADKQFAKQVLQRVEAIPLGQWRPVFERDSFCDAFVATTPAGGEVRLEHTGSMTGGDYSTSSYHYSLFVDGSYALGYGYSIPSSGFNPPWRPERRLEKLYRRLHRDFRIEERERDVLATAVAAAKREAEDKERARQRSILNRL